MFSLDFLLETSHPKVVQGIICKPNSKLQHRSPVMSLSVSSVSVMCLEKVSVLCPFLLFYLVILCCEWGFESSLWCAQISVLAPDASSLPLQVLLSFSAKTSHHTWLVGCQHVHMFVLPNLIKVFSPWAQMAELSQWPLAEGLCWCYQNRDCVVPLPTSQLPTTRGVPLFSKPVWLGTNAILSSK